VHCSYSYTLVYTFKRTSESSCCNGIGAPVQVEQEPQSYDERGRPQTHVTISAEKICICDPAPTVTKKVRSLKCLYLWKCSVRGSAFEFLRQLGEIVRDYATAETTTKSQ